MNNPTDGDLVDLIIQLDPPYMEHVTHEHRKRVINTELDKALYGTVQAALPFWKKLSNFLVNRLGFTINNYDSCVANKMINGKQCTIIWHINDLKISHCDSNVVTQIINSLQEEFRKEAPLLCTA